MKSTPRASTLLSCVAGLMAMACAALAPAAQETTPREIFDALHRQFASVTTIEVSSVNAIVLGDVAPGPDWTVDALRSRMAKEPDAVRIEESQFRMKGELFRLHYDRAPNVRIEIAYDGSRYQMLDLRNRYLRLMGDVVEKHLEVFRLYPQAPAALRPFHFVFEISGKPATFATLRDPSVWAALAAMSEPRENATIDGQRCRVVEITHADHPRHGIERTKIFFAADQDYFPVRYERYIGNDIFQIFQASGVSEAGDCKAPEGPALRFFAGRSTLEDFDWMGSGRHTHTQVIETNLEGIRVNSAIPDDFFTIARSEALFIADERDGD